MSESVTIQDFLSAFNDAGQVTGESAVVTTTVYTRNVIDPTDKPTEVPTSFSCIITAFDFSEEYLPGASIKDGELMGLVSNVESGFSLEQILVGSQISLSTGDYIVTKTKPVLFKGSAIMLYLQLK